MNDYGALYDTKVHENTKNFLTKQDFVNLFTFMDTDGPTDEYKSVLINHVNSTNEYDAKQSVICIKKLVPGLRRLDTRLNQDGVTYESYKALLSHIVNNVLSDEWVKHIYFSFENPHIKLAYLEAVSSGKEVLPLDVI